MALEPGKQFTPPTAARPAPTILAEAHSAMPEAIPDRSTWKWGAFATLEESAPLVDAMVDAMKAAGHSDDEVFAVRLAVEEAVANAVKHGHADDRRRAARFGFHTDAHGTFAEVEDDGPGFDPRKVTDPLLLENLERSSGRGLFLMKSLMTWVRFSNRGNRVTLCKVRSVDGNASGSAASP